MTTRPALLALAVATCLGLTACAGSDDLDTTGLPTADDLAAGGAAGSCLVGDPDCTDESYDGQDVTRAVDLSDAIDVDEDVQPATRGTTSGATGRFIEQAALVDEDTLRLVVVGSPCMLVEDVIVIESPEEVRVMVLGGQDAETQECEDEGLSWSVDVDLEAPLGTRTLLDISG